MYGGRAGRGNRQEDLASLRIEDGRVVGYGERGQSLPPSSAHGSDIISLYL